MSESSEFAGGAGKKLRIFCDLLWRFYANVSPAETAIIERRYRQKDAGELLINAETTSRLREAGRDLILFPSRSFKEIRRTLFSDYAEIEEASPEENAARAPYSPQACKLIALGEPRYDVSETPADFYKNLGFSAGDIPELIRMFTDKEIIEFGATFDGRFEGDEDENEMPDVPESWTQSHSQRALFEFRAAMPAGQFERLLFADYLAAGEDAAGYRVPADSMEMLRIIGEPAYDVMLAVMAENKGKSRFFLRMTELTGDMARDHPQLRDRAVKMLVSQLENYPFHERRENGFLISSLLHLKAVESASLIEKAFAADAVDLSICGDWEEVQISLGLKTKRDTPRRKWLWEEMNRRSDDDAGEVSGDASPGDDDLPALPFMRENPKIGRNDPCPCGSGKKYKKCCLNKAG